MKKWLMGLLVAVLLAYPIYSLSAPVCKADWTGSTDESMLQLVKRDLEAAQGCRKLVVILLSGGGPVISSLEITRLVKDARRTGLVVEIHGRTLLASGAVFVLAAGSPKHRYILKDSLVIIHGLQSSSWFSLTCLSIPIDPKTEDDKALVQLYNLMAVDLAESTGYLPEDVMTWFRCGVEAVGGGSVLINFNLADHLE